MTFPPISRGHVRQPALWRWMVLVGILAMSLVAASIIPMHQAAAQRGIAVSDCLAAGDDECGEHLLDRTCSMHSRCVSAGIVSALPTETTSFGHEWPGFTLAISSGWANFPAKPPPISFA
jgi:hypothetical protein